MSLRARVDQLYTELRALRIAYRDPRTPWYAKALIGLVIAYALSPIDLIPDFIPVIGHLDDALDAKRAVSQGRDLDLGHESTPPEHPSMGRRRSL